MAIDEPIFELDDARERSILTSRSAGMARVLATAARAAQASSAVLLLGESGVGKAAIARYIHDRSSRAPRDFVPLNCEALRPSLIEAELFGNPGLFQKARGGTLFIEAVSELPLELQPRVLDELEARGLPRIEPLSEYQPSPRIITASNVPLERRVREGRFRSDLYYRLNVITIRIPPLRERREDISGLVKWFLSDEMRVDGARPLEIASEALRWLEAHPWPGNIRQLSNLLERAVALSDEETVTVEHLQSAERDDGQFLEAPVPLRPLAEVENDYIRYVLKATRGNISEAARQLGIDRRTLQRKLGRKSCA